MTFPDKSADAAGALPPWEGARLRSSLTGAIRGVLRRVLTEAQYATLYAWHRVMGPPQVLWHRPQTNVRLLRAFGATVGTNVRILPPVTINLLTDRYDNLSIGDHCRINGNTYLDLSAAITLEDYASLGPGVVVMTHNRFNRNAFLEKRLSRMCGCEPVVIKAGAGIKANALILHGVTIGASAVVAGGSVVIKDVPSRHFVSGTPAVTRAVLG